MFQRRPHNNLSYLQLFSSVLCEWRSAPATLEFPLFVEIEGKQIIILFRQFLLIGCQWIIISTLWGPDLASVHRAVLSYLSPPLSQFSFCLPSFLLIMFSLDFNFIIFLVYILWNSPCVLLFLIPDYFCIFLFILIGSVFISSIFITKWHSLPLGIH